MNDGILDAKSYIVSPSDSFFFDNNIWMYLYCPLGNYSAKKQKIYSNLLLQIQRRKASIFISGMVISEFVNRYLRLDFELWKIREKQPAANFKRDYLTSKEYELISNTVIMTVKEILSLSEKMPDNFNSIDMDKILENLTAIDYNDCYYVELLNNRNIILVTDDKDFQKISLDKIRLITT